MKSYIEVDHVSKKFGKDTALYDVCLDMEQGKAYGICGNNGSGNGVDEVYLWVFASDGRKSFCGGKTNRGGN